MNYKKFIQKQQIKLLIHLVLLLTSISLASAANLTIQELIDSFDHNLLIEGTDNSTINITDQTDYMFDNDGDGINDTLVINLTTDGMTNSNFTFIVEIFDKNGVVINTTTKPIDSTDKFATVNFDTGLLSQTKFNYTIRIYDINDTLVFRKYKIETNSYPNYETGTNITSIKDEDVNNNFLRINLTIDSSQAITTNITVILEYNSSTISKTEEKSLSSGVQTVSIDFDNETIKGTHYNNNFTIDTVVVENKIFDFSQNTSIYNYEDFAKISYIKSIADGRIDVDNNNLSEFLEINFTIKVKTADTYTISYDLYDEFNNFVINISKTESLSVGTQNMQTLVNGSEIYKTKINGPYILSFAKLHIGNNTKDIIFDAHTTNLTFYTDYERPPPPDLKVSMDVIFDNTNNITNITVNLSNIGQAPAFNIFLDIFDNTTYTDNRSLAFLTNEETITYNFNATNSSNTTLYTAIVDFDNFVDESNESNNIVQNTQEQVISLAIESINISYSNGTLKIFEFVILNDGAATVTDIYWNFDTGDNNIINSTTNISSLAVNEKAFVYLQYNYSSDGSFNINASATGLSQSDTVTGFLTSSLTIGDLIITSFDDINISGLDVIFESVVDNNLETENITNINWSLTTDDSEIINSTQSFNLTSNESIFIYIQHQYSSSGTYNPIFTVSNEAYSDSESTEINLATPTIGINLIYPTQNINVTQNQFFNVTVDVTCSSGNCGEVNVSLDPETENNITSSSGTLTTTGTAHNEGYSSSDVSTQNCAQGTCDGIDSWEAGFDDANPANTQINWDFNVGSLGISGSDITEITVTGGGCWHGGSARSCNGADDAEFATNSRDELEFQIYDWDSGTYSNFGTYDITDGGHTSSGPGANYQTYEKTKSSGFVDGHISGGTGAKIRIRYNITGATMGSTYDVIGVYDFAFLTITYGTKGLVSTTIGATPFYANESNPRTISLNQGQSQTVTFWVNATGSLDSTHEFYVYANKTSAMSISNQTNKVNITIIT